VIGAKS